jgi:DnaJ-class molecular chaperone
MNKAHDAHETIACAFCRGSGTDPFNVMSELSTCGSCSGTGLRVVPVPHVTCVYCRGSGSYKTYRCPVCEGAGVVAALEGPSEPCPVCAGQAFDSSSGMVCLRCKGRGAIELRGRSSSGATGKPSFEPVGSQP